VLLQRGVAHSPRPCAIVWVCEFFVTCVCLSESFNNLLAPPFPPPAYPQINPDMGRLSPTVVVAAGPGGAIISKTQDRFPRAHPASRLDGRSSPAQATHMKLLNRHPNSHTNRLLHLFNPCGQASIKASRQRCLPWRMHFPSTEVSAGSP